MLKALTILLLLCPATQCFAIQCEKLDYAELKDMDKEGLKATFCRYERSTRLNQDTITQSQDFSLMKDAEVCLDEQIRVSNLYKSKFGEYPEECSR